MIAARDLDGLADEGFKGRVAFLERATKLETESDPEKYFEMAGKREILGPAERET